MRHVLISAAMVAAAIPAAAQIQPHAGAGSSHLQLVDYSEGQIVQLRAAPGYLMMVELSPDERIQNVAIGDSGAWQVSANREGDRLFIKSVEPGRMTNMTVVTSVRTYNFDLVSADQAGADIPYMVQFRYPAPAAAVKDSGYVDVAAIERRLSRYRISGDRALRPSKVSDDGQHTYVTWPPGAPIPAVYAPDRSGSERLLNGMMGTDDVYVIDGVPQKLVFRIDHDVARADRLNPRRVR